MDHVPVCIRPLDVRKDYSGGDILGYEEAGIKEIFHESFNNPIQENMQYLEQLIGEAENRGGA